MWVEVGLEMSAPVFVFRPLLLPPPPPPSLAPAGPAVAAPLPAPGTSALFTFSPLTVSAAGPKHKGHKERHKHHHHRGSDGDPGPCAPGELKHKDKQENGERTGGVPLFKAPKRGESSRTAPSSGSIWVSLCFDIPPL